MFLLLVFMLFVAAIAETENMVPERNVIGYAASEKLIINE